MRKRLAAVKLVGFAVLLRRPHNREVLLFFFLPWHVKKKKNTIYKTPHGYENYFVNCKISN